MVQTGYNTGPRHARAFGHAVSFTKKLDEETKELRDQDIVAAGSLLWNLILSRMPADVLEEVETSLQESGLPTLSTQRVPDGRFREIDNNKLLTMIFCAVRTRI